MNDMTKDINMSEPRIIPAMPFAEYLALPAISAHGLVQMERSPAHYRHSVTAPSDPTPAQQLGTLAHIAILEPARWAKHVTVAPNVDRRTKAGKAQWEDWQRSVQATDAIVATEEQHDACDGMAAAVHAHPYARLLLADGRAEQTLLYERDELACKARPDWIGDGHDVVVDLKTAADASYEAFCRAAGRYTYHIQAAWYLDALRRCGEPRAHFVHLVVESEPPHGVALYELDEEAMHAGRIRVERALDAYAACQSAEDWPAYPREIQSLSLPPWGLL